MAKKSLPRYRQLVLDIAGQINQGVLAPGERLPSLREVCARQGLSLSTVHEAFRQLEDQGLIEARPQSGFFVSARRPKLPVKTIEPCSITVDPLLWQYIQEIPETAPRMASGFRSATPSAELLPLSQLQKLTVDTVRSHPEILADYGKPGGLPALRRQVARQALDWGGTFSTDNIVITNGAIEGLNLALRALTRPGDVVAVESPAYFALLHSLQSMGLRVVEIPTDPEHGISVDALELATRDGAVQAIVLVSSFANPTGALMPETARQRVAELASARDIPLIEDDIYGEFYFGRHRPRPIKSFDRTGHVLYCASFTKSTSPGLRLGWIEAGRYHAQLETQKYIDTHSTAPLNQLVLARFLETGGYARHLRQFRRALASQMQALCSAVRQHFPPATHFVAPKGGFVLWLTLPAPFDSVELFHAARAEGIGFAPGPLFSPRGAYRNCLRLSCTALWTPEQETRLATLARLAARQLG